MKTLGFTVVVWHNGKVVQGMDVVDVISAKATGMLNGEKVCHLKKSPSLALFKLNKPDLLGSGLFHSKVSIV